MILVHGNPVDGFSFVGPFEDTEQAVEYAENNLRGSEWWIAECSAPLEPHDD